MQTSPLDRGIAFYLAVTTVFLFSGFYIFTPTKTYGATAFVQTLGTNNSKSAETSLVISPVSKTVTVGNTIFVAFASDDAGSSYGVTDNLGNSYSTVNAIINSGSERTFLFSAPVTTGGSITSITVSWTSNVTAKAAVAGEFSDVGTIRGIDAANSATNLNEMLSSTSTNLGELLVGASGVEDNAKVSTSGSNPCGTKIEIGDDGTSGGGSASNIWVTLTYLIVDTANTCTFSGISDGSQDQSGVGAIYNAPAAGGEQIPTIHTRVNGNLYVNGRNIYVAH